MARGVVAADANVGVGTVSGTGAVAAGRDAIGVSTAEAMAGTEAAGAFRTMEVDTVVFGAVDATVSAEILATSSEASAGAAGPADGTGGAALMTVGTAGRRRTGSSASRSAAAPVRM
jgi:hypothetical protein